MPPTPLRFMRLHAHVRRPTVAYSALIPRRFQSTTPPPGNSGGTQPPLPTFGGDFSVPLLIVVRTFGRILRYGILGSLLIGVTFGGAYTFAHTYVEHSLLPGDDLPEGEDWEFGLERERWTGRRGGMRRGGGTDDRLGWRGQHLVRSAWMAAHWGVGPPELFADTSTDVDMFGYAVPAREYAYSRAFLANALRVCAQRTKQLGEFPHSDAALDLLERYAEVLERIGGRRFVLDARERYMELVEELAREGRQAEAARAGAKVGDISRRLGESGERWWVWAVRTAAGEQLALPSEPILAIGEVDIVPPEPTPEPKRRFWFWSSKPDPSPVLEAPAFLPAKLPDSPLAQRVTAQALVALSASYSESGQLLPALRLQQAALDLLSPSPNPAPASEASPNPPARTLHSLTLSHACALLTLHRAEVVYALSPPSLQSPAAIASLLLAARSAESVITSLQGLPPSHPDFPASPLPAPPTPGLPLATPFSQSSTLLPPARRLLRDARRAAAHAYALSAILYERKGDWAQAYECAERGMGWVGGEEGMGGTPVSAGPGVEPALGQGDWEGLEVERREVWEVWKRVRERTMESAREAKVVLPPGK
ncbi:hypothetical protein CALVIDRAFT_541636 [Calocera viscosa TUFC12733]|uniref:Uncharacterized protein n=1 Tax=Calocera viscosa (strain TUFC12733) TaxID=1330018 RepID=A0A167HKU2_CALVF|nr:hypothetical protein CALVIDRAFT_541636 [Calocera viscosa TUFC12733]